jgi:hypothetical protein
MTNLDQPAAASGPRNSAPSGADAEPSGSAAINGDNAPPRAMPPPDAAPPAPPSGPDDRGGLDRAEEIVDAFADRVSSLTADYGRRLLRLSSRARE